MNIYELKVCPVCEKCVSLHDFPPGHAWDFYDQTRCGKERNLHRVYKIEAETHKEAQRAAIAHYQMDMPLWRQTTTGADLMPSAFFVIEDCRIIVVRP